MHVVAVLFLIVALVSGISFVPDCHVTDNDVNVNEQRITLPSVGQRSTSSSACSGEISITSQADVDSGPIASCTSIVGDLIFDNASGNITFPSGRHTQLLSVDGSIYCRNNTGLEKLELYGVTSISGSVVVQNAASLVALIADQLRYVQSIEITNVPQLIGIAFPEVGWMESFEIGGSPMSGFNLAEGLGGLTSAGSFYIHDCLSLLGIGLLSLQNITEYFRVEDNGPDMEVALGIQWANNLMLRNIQDIYLDHMVAVNGSMEISDSYNLTQISINTLKFVGANISIENNPNLKFVGLQFLTSIGGSFIETNNSVLTSPGSFNNLQNIASIELVGPFPSLDSVNNSFPELSSVSSGVTVIFPSGTDQGPPTECSWSRADESGKVFQGPWSPSFTCNGTSPGLSTGAKAGVGVVAGIGGVAVIVIAVACCCRRRRKAGVREVPPEMDGQAMQTLSPAKLEMRDGPILKAHA